MPETPTPGPINDPYEAIENVQEGEIARSEQSPMDDAVSGLSNDNEDETSDNS